MRRTKGPAVNERANPILGRDREREQVDRFLAGPRPAMLQIEGQAGIGKSTLWRYGVDAAGQLGYTVLEFRAAEAERSLTFAGLAGLLPDRLLDDVLADVPEPRRHALDAALLRQGSTGATDTGIVGLGVLSVLHALADPSTVLVAIDDLQWMDEPTTHVVGFALRRIAEADVAVLTSVRTEPEIAGTSLDAGALDERRERLALGPLTVGTIGRLVHDRLGLQLPRTTATRLHARSGGNPFIALELGRAMATRGTLPAPGQPFPVSPDAASLVAERIEPLSTDARHALLALSTLGRPTDVHLRRTMGDAPADRALAELVAADLVLIDGSDVRCAHPLIASVSYARARPEERRELHARLANVVDDPEERARHLALAAEGPDPSVASLLEQAASVARRRGATGAAVELAELAVSLTPPSDAVANARRTLRLATYQIDAGSANDAWSALDAAIASMPPGRGRVEALIQRGKVEAEYLGDNATAGRSFEQALEEAADDPSALIRAHIAAGYWGVDDFPGGEGDIESHHAQAALDLLAGHEDEDPASASSALLMLVESGFRAGAGFDVGLLERAVALERAADLPLLDRPSTQGAIGIGFAGQHRASIDALERCLSQAVDDDDWAARLILMRTLAWMRLCVGDFPTASSVAASALALAEEIELNEGATWGMAAQIAAGRGEFDNARAWAEQAVASSGPAASWWWELRGRAARLFLELTRGDAQAACMEADVLIEMAASSGTEYEPGWNRIHGDVIEALIGNHRMDEAGSLVDWFERRAAVSGNPWSVMVSARCRGMLDASAGRPVDALAAFERSLAADALVEMAFERGRTLLAKGQAQRASNQRRAGRETLTAARDLFERCGAPPWAARATAELVAVSGRTAKPTELTAMERRAAELAAAGRTNREIASELFISERTVESHLSSAYRKLGVRSRTELASALPSGMDAG